MFSSREIGTTWTLSKYQKHQTKKANQKKSAKKITDNTEKVITDDQKRDTLDFLALINKTMDFGAVVHKIENTAFDTRFDNSGNNSECSNRTPSIESWENASGNFKFWITIAISSNYCIEILQMYWLVRRVIDRFLADSKAKIIIYTSECIGIKRYSFECVKPDIELIVTNLRSINKKDLLILSPRIPFPNIS